jgi:hypothetical protein
MKIEKNTLWENIFDSSRAKVTKVSGHLITYVKDGGEAPITKFTNIFLKFYKPLYNGQHNSPPKG